MKLKIKLDDGHYKQVKFNFEQGKDTSLGVAQEMVREMKLHHEYVDMIAKCIQF